MGQMGFFDIANRYAGLDAKNDPLARIDAVVPWENFRARLEAIWRKPAEDRKSPAGRKPWDAVAMFKAIVLCELHKVAPALAAGNAVSPQASATADARSPPPCSSEMLILTPGRPLATLKTGERLYRGTVGAGWHARRTRYLVLGPSTGSTRVEAGLIQAIGRPAHRTQLELGNVSGTIVCADSRDLDHARMQAHRRDASFRKAGQVCTSVQAVSMKDTNGSLDKEACRAPRTPRRRPMSRWATPGTPTPSCGVTR